MKQADWEEVKKRDQEVAAQLNSQQRVLEFLRTQLIVYQVIGCVVLVAGFVLMMGGFWLWYDRLQRHLDRQVAAPPT